MFVSSLRFSSSMTSTPRKTRESIVTQHMKELKHIEFEEKCNKLRQQSQQIDDFSDLVSNEYESALDRQTNNLMKTLPDLDRILLTPPPKRQKNLNLPKFSPNSPYLKKKASTEGPATPPMMKYYPMSL